MGYHNMTSQRIQLEKLNNTRDLYGMQTRDKGRIKAGKLLRSGHLYGASEQDLNTLSERVNLVVDFRTDKERQEKPNPSLDDAAYLHLPILKSLTAGVTREKAAVENAVRTQSHDSEGARQYMMRMYVNFVADEFAVAQYAAFLRLLCEDREGAVLWHCTAGKDRAGFATVLVQEILGVSREDIFEDYLMTNLCLREEVTSLIHMIQSQSADSSEEALQYLFGAKEDYLMALYHKVDELYGGFEEFVRKGLQLDAKQQERLRNLYLD